jgi:hypothetical protein
MSLEKLQVKETNIDMYTTEYVNISCYKMIRIISKFSNSAYLYIYHSNDQKNDHLTSTFLCNANKSSLHKIEVVCDYIRITITPVNQGNELIDEVELITRGRRSINSNLYNLLEKFQPAQTVQELKEDEPVSRAMSEEPKERTSGIYRRLGLYQKKKDEKPSEHKCRCSILPEILLPGQLLFVKDMGRITTIPPPIQDGNQYTLICQNKCVYWCSVNDIERGGIFN